MRETEGREDEYVASPTIPNASQNVQNLGMPNPDSSPPFVHISDSERFTDLDEPTVVGSDAPRQGQAMGFNPSKSVPYEVKDPIIVVGRMVSPGESDSSHTSAGLANPSSRERHPTREQRWLPLRCSSYNRLSPQRVLMGLDEDFLRI